MYESALFDRRELTDSEKKDEKAETEIVPIKTKCEYIMMDPDEPIRREQDKLEKAASQTASKTALQLSYSKTVLPAELSEEEHVQLESAIVAAHQVLGCRDYSLFDFRIQEGTGKCYILEACAFWSFTPISWITKLLANSATNSEDTRLGDWRELSQQMWKRVVQRSGNGTLK